MDKTKSHLKKNFPCLFICMIDYSGFAASDGLVIFYLLLADMIGLIDVGMWAVIENAMMHIASVTSHPEAKDKNGDIKPAIRDHLKKWETEAVWCKPTAYCFSLQYRKRTLVPGSSGFPVPSGSVTLNKQDRTVANIYDQQTDQPTQNI